VSELFVQTRVYPVGRRNALVGRFEIALQKCRKLISIVTAEILGFLKKLLKPTDVRVNESASCAMA